METTIITLPGKGDRRLFVYKENNSLRIVGDCFVNDGKATITVAKNKCSVQAMRGLFKRASNIYERWKSVYEKGDHKIELVKFEKPNQKEVSPNIRLYSYYELLIEAKA